MRLDLNGLADASREALMSEWRAVVGRPPPKHLSKPLMVQILSRTYQMDAVGGYTKRLDSRLKSAARRDVVRPAFKPGSRFVREYHGITHVVEGCCQTNRLKHQKHEEREFYEAIRERHSVRAASRFSLKVLRFESDLCELK